VLKGQTKEIANMLSCDGPEVEKVHGQVEDLIRDNNLMHAYAMLRNDCLLLSKHIKTISSRKKCPPDLVSAVSTLIWASTYFVQTPELQKIRAQFKYKYGEDFIADSVNNEGGVVNEDVMDRLASSRNPDPKLIQVYLDKIAKDHKVDWKREEFLNISKAPKTFIPHSMATGNLTHSFAEWVAQDIKKGNKEVFKL